MWQVLSRVLQCGADVVSRWKPASDKATPPVAVTNIAKSVKAFIERQDTVLRGARLWVAAARALLGNLEAGEQLTDDGQTLREAANHCVQAVQALQALVAALVQRVPQDTAWASVDTRLRFVCGLEDAPTHAAAVQSTLSEAVTDAPAVGSDVQPAAKKRSRWGS